MQIIPTVNLQYQPLTVRYNTVTNPQSIDNKGLSCDKFQRTTPVTQNVSFQSSVTEGQFLRGLSGIRDPYSDVIILNNKEMNQIYQDLSKTRTSRDKIKYLSQYTESMLPVEETVFYMLETGLQKERHASLNEILTEEKPQAIQNIIKTQAKILDKMEELSANLSDSNRNKVYGLIDKSRPQILLPKEDSNHFKKHRLINDLVRISQYETLKQIENSIRKLPGAQRKPAMKRFREAHSLFLDQPYNTNVKGKTPLERILELQEEFIPETLGEPNELEPIIDLANTLPTSKDSVDAFIVEMADKDDKTIAKRLVSESLGTIEHIVPESKGGVNEAYNFIFVTKSRNEERSNTPMKYFMRKYPDIPKYCKHYIEDIMKAGQTSKLRGREWYPYVIKETMHEEMGVDVNISSYRVSPKKAFKTFPERLKEKYPQFRKYFTNAQ